MKGHAQTKLASRRRETFQLWFEYLRLAKKSTDGEIVEALKRSAAFYEPWGDVNAESFHEWWKQKGHLFEEQKVIRRLESNETPSDPTALALEIPLNQSPTRLTRVVKALIEEAWAEQNEQHKLKNKTIASAKYHLAEGSEPKLDAIRDTLTVYRDVYLKNTNMSTRDLLAAIEAHYKKRKLSRIGRVPMALVLPTSNTHLSLKMRNLRRYINRAQTIMLNVANGEFPGKH